MQVTGLRLFNVAIYATLNLGQKGLLLSPCAVGAWNFNVA